MRYEVNVYACLAAKPPGPSGEESLEPCLLEGFVAGSDVRSAYAVDIREEFLG
jgi:hypothetical protein